MPSRARSARTRRFDPDAVWRAVESEGITYLGGVPTMFDALDGALEAADPAPRLDTLRGATVGIVSNGKKGTKPFFDAFEQALVDTHGASVIPGVNRSVNPCTSRSTPTS